MTSIEHRRAVIKRARETLERTKDIGKNKPERVPRKEMSRNAPVSSAEYWHNDKVIHKTVASAKTKGLNFILSDATIDRYGDSIMSDGWELDNFRKNPIALFLSLGEFPDWQMEKHHGQ